jgi:putative ABC transport system permease protein
MLGLDRWREILETLWRRKLRTLLTALSVSWGIFMLVILLGAGNGLSNGAQAEFGRDATNSVWVNPGRLSKPFEGQPVGKVVRFQNRDYDLVLGSVKVADRSSARFNPPGEITVTFGNRHAGFNVRGVHPEYELIEKTTVVSGRYLNEDDLRERRKVAVIGMKVKESLFTQGEPPLGAIIRIGNASFQVVGVFEEENDQQELQTIYIPVSSAQLVYGGSAGAGRVDQISFTVGDSSVSQTEAAVEELRQQLSVRHRFSPEDKRAVFIWNTAEMSEKFNGLFRGIRAFIWVIGLGTILAGVVGVSNIMLISVQERTREIGVRKAVGAPPATIVAMIVEEALAITVVSGYLGLVAGIGLLTFAQKVLPKTPFFQNPDVDLRVAVAATAVLVFAGVLAGLFPALRAARINPIAALRVE